MPVDALSVPNLKLLQKDAQRFGRGSDSEELPAEKGLDEKVRSGGAEESCGVQWKRRTEH